MKRTLILGVIFCLFLVISPCIAKGAPAGPPEELDVKIVNPLPVPVEGEFAVTNDENNPVPVSIINTPTVDQPGRWPYQCMLTFSDSDADHPTYIWLELPIVPEGKRLVIEHISALIYTDGPEGTLDLLAFASPDASNFVFNAGNLAIVQPLATKGYCQFFCVKFFSANSLKKGRFLATLPIGFDLQ